MAEFTPYQKKIIGRYYDRQDDIVLTRLGEIVGELYLARTEGQVKKLWSRADKAMAAMKVPRSVAEHILAQRKPELLAEHLRDWQAGRKKTKHDP